MTWTAEVFQPRHGEVGVAAASALVSGLGNLGSIVSTYALYEGWQSDAAAPGRLKYRNSNLVLVAMLCTSIIAAILNEVLLRTFGSKRAIGSGEDSDDGSALDGAAKREVNERGFEGLFRWRK
jgi:hypothetical protein